MEEGRCQKIINYKRNLSVEFLFPQKDENALMTILHSVNELFLTIAVGFITIVTTIINPITDPFLIDAHSCVITWDLNFIT